MLILDLVISYRGEGVKFNIGISSYKSTGCENRSFFNYFIQRQWSPIRIATVSNINSFINISSWNMSIIGRDLFTIYNHNYCLILLLSLCTNICKNR